MAQISKNKKLTRSFLTLFGLGIILFSIALPLIGMISQGDRTARLEDIQAHRELVAEVVLSKTQAELVGNSPTRGNPEAALILIKFSDFQCPFCRMASGDMKTFMDGHESDVLYVYKHFPLTRIHPEALPAARASWAAQLQGKFWAFHDALFANQSQLGDARYEEIAEELGLDMDQFHRDRTSAESRAVVEADLEFAQQMRLTSTPTFVLNDLLIPGGAPVEFMEQLVSQLDENR